MPNPDPEKGGPSPEEMGIKEETSTQERQLIPEQREVETGKFRETFAKSLRNEVEAALKDQIEHFGESFLAKDNPDYVWRLKKELHEVHSAKEVTPLFLHSSDGDPIDGLTFGVLHKGMRYDGYTYGSPQNIEGARQALMEGKKVSPEGAVFSSRVCLKKNKIQL